MQIPRIINGHDKNIRAPLLAQTTCDVLYLANAPVDLIARRNGVSVGNKHPSQVEMQVGGPGANGGRVLVAHGCICGVICLQGQDWAAMCRQMFHDRGIHPTVIERNGGSFAITLGIPNGKPGAFELFTHRIAPNIRLNELRGEPMQQIRHAGLMIVGPMAKPDDETLEVLEHVAANSQYAALQPHPDLICHPRFADLAKRFNLVAMNADEAGVLGSPMDTALQRAELLRDTLGEGTDFIMTNGPDRGWACLHGDWFPFEPPPVIALREVGAGDVFLAEFVFRFRIKGQPAREALAEAMRVAALWVSNEPLAELRANSVAAFSSESNTHSWAEIAL